MTGTTAMILSYGGDTNGQNARYVEAARRWGTDPAVIDALALGRTDPAGVVGRFQDAASKHGGLNIRSAHRSTPYMSFPADLIWTRHTEPEIRTLAEQADVIHLNNSEAAYRRFHLRQPALLHHHGSLFRADPPRMLVLAKQNRWAQAVSTVDLQRPDPKVLHWLPTAYDVDALQAMRAPREPDGKIRIVHAPTNRSLKATDALIEAVKGIPAAELVLVEGKPWAEVMAIKATADIVFDQIAFGYGCNAVEAWGMGIPVISGADEWTTQRMRDLWGETPYAHATEATLADVLRKMVKSADMRAEWAAKGLAHVRAHHDEKPALARLAELYADAIRTHAKPRIPGKGVTFASKTGRTVRFDDQAVTFVDGRATVEDPFVVGRLRYFATQRPTFGITEVKP